jgi:amino acid transporter
MKKIKSPGSMTGFGIGCVVVLAIIMIVHFYLKFDDQPFHIRVLEGILRFGGAILGSGLIMLICLFAFYGATKISEMVFRQEESTDDLLDGFMKNANPLLIICFIAAYILIYLEM